ncbi:uncharacterized protein LOC124361946 isoform X1 [Homalodisca vitripennis]|uniref:uncharacterized protein LOC124361946 isoform X1 n=2 Tax=Homalodisca vitripennis TaxID=197043 RepID=UPI001EE9AF7A|nr:uncharacterized protein LOC124361946 isoform X1 [Homalodisca vitripennis]
MSDLQQQTDDVPGNCESRLSLEDAGDDSVTDENVTEYCPEHSPLLASGNKDRNDDLGCCWWKIIRNCLCPWTVPRKNSQPTETSSVSEVKDESGDDNLSVNSCVPCMYSYGIPEPPVYIPPAQPEVPNPEIPPQMPPQGW